MGRRWTPLWAGFIVTAVLASACGADLGATSFLRIEAFEFSILVREAKSDPSTTLIDLRTPEEVATGFISGATNIDALDEGFLDVIDELDRDDHYLLYGRSSAASAEAARILKEAGFTHLTELNGGIGAWIGSGRSLESH